MSKKSHHFLMLWPWPLTYDLEKLIRSGHYHYQYVYQIWEQSIQWFLSYRDNTIAGGGRLRRKTVTSPDSSDTGDIINTIQKIDIDSLSQSSTEPSVCTVFTETWWRYMQLSSVTPLMCPQLTLRFPKSTHSSQARKLWYMQAVIYWIETNFWELDMSKLLVIWYR